MPVTTLSDLKEKRCRLAEDIAWAKREATIAATEYERQRAEDRLPGLNHEYMVVCEEIRQAESARFAWLSKYAALAVVVAAVIGLIALLG